MSSSFTFKDLVCEYKMGEQKFENVAKNIKDQINAVFYKNLGSDEFKDETIQKSMKAVKELKLENKGVFEVSDFEKLKKGKLSLVGGFQTSKHSSHHILSMAHLNETFLVTGHSDSTFKIWFLNPSYFQTPFATPGIKAVGSKDLAEEDFIKGKRGGSSKPFELVIFV
jgi:hypothetical protein